ncbi:MAG TPA: hypothetical protein VIK72_09745 [Clostridiaceae bacterium]
MVEQLYYKEIKGKHTLINKSNGFPLETFEKSLKDSNLPKDISGQVKSQVSYFINCKNLYFLGSVSENEKDSFYMHTYSFDLSNMNKLIDHPERLICPIFSPEEEDSFNLGLPSLIDVIFNEKEDIYDNHYELFKELNLTEEDFDKLLNAVFDTIKLGKRIIIELNSDKEEALKQGKSLLKFIYLSLPYALRRKLSFVFFLKEIKYLPKTSIVFMEKGSFKKKSMEKDNFYFILDEKGLTTNYTFQEDNIFIRYVYGNLESYENLDKCFKLGDIIIKNSYSLEDYNKLLRKINDYSFIATVSNRITENSYISEMVEEINQMVRKDTDKYYTVDLIYNLLNYYSSEYSISELRGKYSYFCDLVNFNLFKYIYGTIDLFKLTRKDILRIHLRDENEGEENYIIIDTIQKLIEIKNFTELYDLSKSIALEGKETLKKINLLTGECFKEYITESNYHKITAGFIKGSYDNGLICYDFKEILSYIAKNKGDYFVVKYVIWMWNDFKIVKGENIYKDLCQTVKSFLVEKKNIYKDKSIRKELKNIKNTALVELLCEVKVQAYGSLKRFFIKTFKKHKDIGINY